MLNLQQCLAAKGGLHDSQRERIEREPLSNQNYTASWRPGL